MASKRQSGVLDARLPGWEQKSLARLAADQGVAQPQKLDELVGAGAALWEDDQEFESFLQGIYERRKEGRRRPEPDP